MLRERERKNKQTYKKQNKKTTSRSRRRNNIIPPPSVLVFPCITTLTSFAFHRGKSVNNNLKRRESKFGRDFKRFGHLLRGKFSGGITRFFFFFRRDWSYDPSNYSQNTFQKERFSVSRNCKLWCRVNESWNTKLYLANTLTRVKLLAPWKTTKLTFRAFAFISQSELFKTNLLFWNNT